MLRRGIGSAAIELITYICFDEDILVLQIFWLVNRFLYPLIFWASPSSKRNISLIEVCTYQTAFFTALCYFSVGISYFQVPVLTGQFYIIFIPFNVELSFIIWVSFFECFFTNYFVISAFGNFFITHYCCYIDDDL